MGSLLIEGAQPASLAGADLGAQPAVIVPSLELLPILVVPHLPVAQLILFLQE